MTKPILSGKNIGISLSGEYGESGLSVIQKKDMSIELVKQLLHQDAHLIYGGDLRERGYTYTFSELSFQYRQKELYDKKHYSNYLAWPIHLKLNASDEAYFKINRVATIKINAAEGV